VQYVFKDEDLDCNHEIEDMEDSSEGEESIDEDVFFKINEKWWWYLSLCFNLFGYLLL